MAMQDDKRFQFTFFFIVTSVSFLVFAGLLYALEGRWNKTFLTVTAVSSVLAAVAFLIEWTCRVFGWGNEKSPNDFPA